jgi:hypothetical protein
MKMRKAIFVIIMFPSGIGNQKSRSHGGRSTLILAGRKRLVMNKVVLVKMNDFSLHAAL